MRSRRRLKKLWPAAYWVGLTRSNSFAPGFPPESACTAADTDTESSGTWALLLLLEPSMLTPMPCSRYPNSFEPVAKPCDNTLLVAPPTET